MCKKSPFISIVTPSLNQAAYIEENIKSVFNQNYPNFEHIIIDGGSTDGTIDIIRKYDHLIWVSEKDSGQSQAINKGFKRAKGEIFGWLNSDDFLLPGAISLIVEMYKKYPAAVAWVGGCYRVDPNGRILSCVIPHGLDRDSLADWGHRGFFYQPSCFFAARAWKETGLLDEDLQFAFDLDMWLRLSSIGTFASTTDIISAAIIHKDAKTQAQRRAMHAETVAIQVKHGYLGAAINRLVDLLEKPSWNSRMKIKLKASLKDLGNTLRILNRNEEPRHVQFPSDRFTKRNGL
ncbi:MAG: glycosyltransferase family 2 protein [Promethearchaeota archaeon]